MMAKEQLGKRHHCFDCGCLFYDLNKPAAVCPKCGADQANAPKPTIAAESRSSRSKRSAEKDYIPMSDGDDFDDEGFDDADDLDTGDDDMGGPPEMADDD
ncbi:MAG: FYDLN acid domain-containing protein [Deltaproteobacteria bacterium]|nr:FYDLN acid domain-containing protein [bacterium]MCB9476470.1 FYDLN acid domain-containing protein [Deltaproteobacteria bacterium]MCB9478891.1 FYDLN acid domain-containing protein [Deltaproteobacteria bacterium]MCB9489397.1 FYDLN acid domain-containing protein [Deltaproteobacteria bacterium]